MSESEDVTAAAAVREGKALEYVQQAVQRRYPGVPAVAIAERMRKVHRRYDHAPIRDFVPLLVERELTLEMRAATGPGPELGRQDR